MKLPIFEGWIVDAKLREFRRETWGDAMEENIVSFDTEKGDIMLCDYIATLKPDSKEFERIAKAIC